MSTFVVLLNWNGWRDTIECLESLFELSGTGFSIVVCDNESSDGSLAKLSSWADAALSADAVVCLTKQQVLDGARMAPSHKLALVANGGNLGFAGGNNVGVQLAMNDPDCKYVWLLNNDTTVAPDALSTLVARAEADPTIGLCGSTLVYFHNQQMVQAFGGAIYNRFTGRSRHIGAFASLDAIPVDPVSTEQGMSYVVGASMLVSRAYIEQVGMMQEDYFLYYEEIDWCTRGNGRFRLGYAPYSRVFHKEGASIGTTAAGGSALSVYYLFRNRVRFTARFYPGLLALVMGACVWDIFKLLVKRRFAVAAAAVRGTVLLPRLPTTRKVTP